MTTPFQQSLAAIPSTTTGPSENPADSPVRREQAPANAQQETCIVTATSLNLRSSPRIANGNVLASLHQGQELLVIDRSDAAWWKVQAKFPGRDLDGFGKTEYLRLQRDAPAAPIHGAIERVDFPANARARLDSIDARHCPMPESGFPLRPVSQAASAFDKTSAIDRLIDALDVVRSLRYQPTRQSTYCNIYAYDVCHFAQVYLPRVWWKSKALIALSQGKSVAVRYDDTVQELNANALYDWLCEWGDSFGWVRTFDVTELQERANAGNVGVICAKRRELSRSGHITCVIPETDRQRVERQGARVIAPLQSQAGATNKARFSNSWWIDRAPEYSATGFWYHA